MLLLIAVSGFVAVKLEKKAGKMYFLKCGFKIFILNIHCAKFKEKLITKSGKKWHKLNIPYNFYWKQEFTF